MKLTVLYLFLLYSFLLSLSTIGAQPLEKLNSELVKRLQGVSAKVSVAIQGVSPEDTLTLYGNRPMPMQSVFKYHLAVVVLHQVDKGDLRMDQPIQLTKEQLNRYKHLWSPIRKEITVNTELSLAEVLRYTVSNSDNLGCDILMKMVGGPNYVENYWKERGINQLSIRFNEIDMQAQWNRQYENWTTAIAANQALKRVFENQSTLLTEQSRTFLFNCMRETTTGTKRLKAFLPKGTIVAHKTGSSMVNEKGVTGAFNDIGIIQLSDNEAYYLSVFISDSKEGTETNEKIIADISSMVWKYMNQ